MIGTSALEVRMSATEVPEKVGCTVKVWVGLDRCVALVIKEGGCFDGYYTVLLPDGSKHHTDEITTIPGDQLV